MPTDAAMNGPTGGRGGRRRKAGAKTATGLWIDHKRAVLVTATAGGDVVAEVVSHVDKQPGRLAGVRSVAPYESQMVQSDGCQERRYTDQLNQYYARVIALLRGAGTLLILGPGEAKGELWKRLARAATVPRRVTMETADKMTNRQIVARVRAHYELEQPTGAARQGAPGNQRQQKRSPSRRTRG